MKHKQFQSTIHCSTTICTLKWWELKEMWVTQPAKVNWYERRVDMKCNETEKYIVAWWELITFDIYIETCVIARYAFGWHTLFISNSNSTSNHHFAEPRLEADTFPYFYLFWNSSCYCGKKLSLEWWFGLIGHISNRLTVPPFWKEKEIWNIRTTTSKKYFNQASYSYLRIEAHQASVQSVLICFVVNMSNPFLHKKYTSFDTSNDLLECIVFGIHRAQRIESIMRCTCS